ncbi:MAG: DUF1800 domain-containing protein [Candidatus Obscuribacterales bacterium]|nr:DUF1800 domain-containing protein [Candidatus Obscuribacterales bacterium]
MNIANGDRFWISHLIRRAGFGATPQEMRRYLQLGYDELLDELLHPERIGNSALETQLSTLNLDFTKLADIQRWWLYRMCFTSCPLQEKMTLFWHGHFATSNRKVNSAFAMYIQNMSMRKYGLGDFQQLLLTISKDPAMIIWLDNQQNKKGKPNENYAREIMELFTIGIGNYNENDVKEAARAFTGWHTNIVAYKKNVKQHDDDKKVFLGQNGNWDGEDIVRILAEQPATGYFLANKLSRFFVMDDPPNSMVKRIAERYSESNRDIRQVMRAIFTDKNFLSKRAYHSKIKSPVEFAVGTVKMLQIKHLDESLPGQIERMGQSLFQPPNVKGWDGGKVWISSDKMMARFNFSAVASGARVKRILEFAPLSKLLAEQNVTDAAQLVDYFATLLVDGDLSRSTRSRLIDYVSSDNGRIVDTIKSERALEVKVRGLVHLIMTLPAYQLC